MDIVSKKTAKTHRGNIFTAIVIVTVLNAIVKFQWCGAKYWWDSNILWFSACKWWYLGNGAR